MREAIESLDIVVVIDVAMSETAREAHYVLPSSSQYEKWEATFFGAAVQTETEYATFSLFALRFSSQSPERCPRVRFIAGSFARSAR